MSSNATPISASRFALAITDLPLSNLHTKAAEIRNSIAHLQHSNEQLAPDAERGDPDCAAAIKENVEVLDRMNERLGLLKKEVERRGFRWDESEGQVVNGDGGDGDAMDVDGDARQASAGETGLGNGSQHQTTNVQSASGSGNNIDAAAATRPAQGSNSQENDMLALLQARLRDSDEHGLHL